MLPSINDLPLFWPLLATYGTGQKVTVYNSIFTGPKKKGAGSDEDDFKLDEDFNEFDLFDDKNGGFDDDDDDF